MQFIVNAVTKEGESYRNPIQVFVTTQYMDSPETPETEDEIHRPTIIVRVPRKVILARILENSTMPDVTELFFRELNEHTEDVIFKYHTRPDSIELFVESVFTRVDSKELFWDVEGFPMTFDEYLKYQKFCGILEAIKLIPAEARPSLIELTASLFS